MISMTIPTRSRSSTKNEATTVLFARLPVDLAEQLTRGAFELGVSKQALVTALVDRHVDVSTPRGLKKLRELTEGEPLTKTSPTLRGTTRARQRSGVHEAPDVLTAAQLASLLQLDVAAVVAAAETGTIPGRRVGTEWRFLRQAIIDWLSVSDADGSL